MFNDVQAVGKIVCMCVCVCVCMAVEECTEEALTIRLRGYELSLENLYIGRHVRVGCYVK